MSETAGAASPQRKGALMVWIGALIMVASVATFGSMAYKVVSGAGLTRPFTAPVQQAPGTFSVSMDEGTFAVYQDMGATGAPQPDLIRPDQVRVTAPDNTTLRVSAPNGSQTVTRNGREFRVVAQWVVENTNTYVVTISSGAPASVVIAPGLIAEFARVGLVGLLTFLACATAGLIGLALLVWGLVRRRRTRPVTASSYGYGSSVAGGVPPPVQPPAAYPPIVPADPAAPQADPPPPAVAAGWYPDPQRPGGTRYWDGRTWTDHRA
jgi:hypothetical protein